jgi:hypothetical protein
LIGSRDRSWLALSLINRVLLLLLAAGWLTAHQRNPIHTNIVAYTLCCPLFYKKKLNEGPT